MMKETKYLTLLICMAVCCTPLSEIPDEVGNGERTEVPVSLTLSVAPEEILGQAGESLGTKADYDPDLGGYSSSAAIKTITVLQFEKDEVGDGYTRVGNQVCYDWAAVDAGTENIALVTSSRENIIFVIANATAPGSETIPLSGHTSLADFLANQNGNLLSTLDDATGSGIWYCPAGEPDKYLRMSASIKVASVTLGTTIGTPANPLYLKRNCAKLVIKVKNTSASAAVPVSIDAVQLRDINRLNHYVANIPAALSPIRFIDNFSPQNTCRIDEPEQAFPVEKNPGGADEGTEQEYVFYVPANLRGTITNTAQSDKNRHAPQGATRFCIYASYGSPAKSITYTYYLGANLLTDFNLEPNKKYEYTIELNGKGNPLTDTRIEDVDEVKFAVDANCYMLKPPTRTGATSTFSIPVRRAAVFWNQPGTNMGVYGAATTDSYLLEESTTWRAWLVWNQVKDANGDPVADSELLPGSSYNSDMGKYVVDGRGFNPANGSANPFIKVKVMAGMRGSALVAIKKTSGSTMDDVLWSWHLWVTDYDPYADWTKEDGTYIYAVPGGEIHRYADKAGTNLWGTGDYATAFIMDRNIGATEAIPSSSSVEFAIGCFYQCGRKDPLIVGGSTIASDATNEPGEGKILQNIRYSVHHPDTFIDGPNEWTAVETSGAVLFEEITNKTWHDPKFLLHGGDYCEVKKSIYDPCPYGWQVPKDNTWSEFSNATTETTTSPSPVGKYYYPEGYDPLVPKGRVYYPYRVSPFNMGGVYGNLDSIYCWGLSTSGAKSLYGGYKKAAWPVRCIRLDYSRPY